MNGIGEFMQENLRELIWSVVCVFIGWALEWSRQKIIKLRRDSSRKKKRETFNANGIISLDHGDPFYGANEDGKATNGSVSCPLAKDSAFFIPLPETLIERVSEADYPVDFESRPATWFGEELPSFSALQKRMREYGEQADIKLPGLDTLLVKAREKAEKVVSARIESGATIFNGKKYGIKKIAVTRTADEHENSVLTIHLYETDYFTYLVMGQLSRELTEIELALPRTNSIQTLNNYYPFLTSLGVNALVVSTTGDDQGKVALCLRSGNIDNMNGEARWHVSMNEGLSVTDKVGERVYLDNCVQRGLEEELHVRLANTSTKSGYAQGRVYFGDLFLVSETFEVGITAVCLLDMPCVEIAEAHRKAKDGALESDSDLAFIDLNAAAAKKFIRENKTTEILEYALSMATLVDPQFYS